MYKPCKKKKKKRNKSTPYETNLVYISPRSCHANFMAARNAKFALEMFVHSSLTRPRMTHIPHDFFHVSTVSVHIDTQTNETSPVFTH